MNNNDYFLLICVIGKASKLPNVNSQSIYLYLLLTVNLSFN